MFTLSPRLLASAALGCALLMNAPQAFAFDAKETSAIQSIIHDYIMDNPDVVIASLEKQRADAELQKQAEKIDMIKNNQDALTGKAFPSIGNPKGDVTVVEFFDYNCGYCKRALPDLINLVESDKNVRVVFHEFPILSAGSRTAALWALAAHKQGHYFDFHKALMQHRGAKNEDTLSTLAKDLGLDVGQMKKDAASKETAKLLQDSVDLARKLGISGTPAFVVNDQFFGGYIGHDGLIEAIKAARAQK